MQVMWSRNHSKIIKTAMETVCNKRMSEYILGARNLMFPFLFSHVLENRETLSYIPAKGNIILFIWRSFSWSGHFKTKQTNIFYTGLWKSISQLNLTIHAIEVLERKWNNSYKTWNKTQLLHCCQVKFMSKLVNDIMHQFVKNCYNEPKGP